MGVGSTLAILPKIHSDGEALMSVQPCPASVAGLSKVPGLAILLGCQFSQEFINHVQIFIDIVLFHHK